MSELSERSDGRALTEDAVDADAIVQFQRWFDEAVAARVPQPDAMVLATVGDDGQPSARNVLLKGIDRRGFAFFTNRASRKGRELAHNPACALVFRWEPLERQVCVTGTAEPVPDDESDTYFASRPRGSRLGALASAQSSVIAGREVLEQRLAELEAEYGHSSDIPRPPSWGGYVVSPNTLELWQGRPNRLHDRLRYSRTAAGAWVLERLSP